LTAPNGHDPALAEHVARALGGAVASGSGWMCKCPCHDDGTASLSVSVGDKQPLLVHCHAGCDGKDVLAEIGRRGLTPERETKPAARRIAATYDYVDEHGVVLYQVVRYDPKDFKQRQPDGAGGWRWTMAGARYVPYHLPAVIASHEVIVVEGEKDADNLAKLGLAATTNVGGAEGKNGKSKWRPEYAQALKGKHVLILPDNDPPGRLHAAVVAASLAGLALSVRVLELPGLPEKGDVSDWLARGGTLEELRTLALARDAPAREAWTPKQDQSEPSRVTRPRDAPAREAWTDQLIRKGKNPEPAPFETNVLRALRLAPELAGRVRLNGLSEQVELRDMPWCKEADWRPWLDTDDGSLAAWLQDHGMFVKPGTCANAVAIEASAHPHHPVRHYLATLRWDGRPRLSTWLVDCLGAHDAPPQYLAAVGRAWLISLVARVMRPGCQADHLLILEGPQGSRKSTALRSLVPDPAWFTDNLSALGTKDYAQDLRGKWLIELSELSAMGKALAASVKAAITHQIDHYRPSYGRHSRDFPRQCIFAGTTNEHAYLFDSSGNRRFWPVKVGLINLARIAADRDQLWAEAVHAYEAGEAWHLDPKLEKAAAAQQRRRLEDDPWTGDVLRWAGEQSAPFTVSEVLFQGLALQDAAKRDKRAAVRVGAILRQVGYAPKHSKRGQRWEFVTGLVTPSSPGSSPEYIDKSKIYKKGDEDAVNQATPNTRAQTSRARVTRTHMELLDSLTSLVTLGPNPLTGQENSGDDGSSPPPAPAAKSSSPPWTDWTAWRQRCTRDPVAHKAWLAAAGGHVAANIAWLPKDLDKGKAREWLEATLAGEGLEPRKRTR
jgi:predicted P-loop ATPase